VRLWDPAVPPPPVDASAHQGRGIYAAIPTGPGRAERAISVCDAGLLKVWDLDTGLCLSTQLPFWRVAPDHVLTGAAALGSGDAVVLADSRGVLKCVEPGSGRQRWRVQTGGPCLAIAADPEGTLIAAADRATIGIHEAANGALRQRLRMPLETPLEPLLTFVAPDRLIAAAGPAALMLSPSSGELTGTLQHGGAILSALAAGAPGFLYAGCVDGWLRLFDLERGELSRAFQAHERRITALAAAPDGSLVCSGGADRSLKLWTAGGRCVGRFELDGEPTALAFGPDGHLVAMDGSGRVSLLSIG
jgi:WD40 repeat protein